MSAILGISDPSGKTISIPSWGDTSRQIKTLPVDRQVLVKNAAGNWVQAINIPTLISGKYIHAVSVDTDKTCSELESANTCVTFSPEGPINSVRHDIARILYSLSQFKRGDKNHPVYQIHMHLSLNIKEPNLGLDTLSMDGFIWQDGAEGIRNFLLLMQNKLDQSCFRTFSSRQEFSRQIRACLQRLPE